MKFRALAEKMHDNQDKALKPARTAEEWEMWQRSIFEFGNWLDDIGELVEGDAAREIARLRDSLEIVGCVIPDIIDRLKEAASDNYDDGEKAECFRLVIKLMELKERIVNA